MACKERMQADETSNRTRDCISRIGLLATAGAAVQTTGCQPGDTHRLLRQMEANDDDDDDDDDIDQP